MCVCLCVRKISIFELKSDFYVTKVLFDADFDKNNENFLRSTFRPLLGHLRGREGPKIDLIIFLLFLSKSASKSTMVT